MKGEDFILELLSDLESDRIERTISTTNTDKFSEAICAFANDYANHRQPGYLLIGVKDDGSLSGLKVTDEMMTNLAAIRHNGQILPQPAMSVQRVSLPEGDVLIVEVTPSLHPPVRYKGRVWIRTGPTKAVANETEERRLVEKRTATARTFDAMPCLGARLEDLSIELFKLKYLPTAIDEELLKTNNREVKLQLASLKMYDILHEMPTNAGVLTLASKPTNWLYGAYIQYVKFAGEEMTGDTKPVEKVFSGNLIDVLHNVQDFIKYNMIETRTHRTDSFKDRQTQSYPFVALRELVINAVLHRDYESNAPIYIYQFSNRIEIHNPGGLYGDARPSNFPNVSAYRNPNLAEILKNLEFVNKFNFGIKTSQDVLKSNGNPPAEFDFSLGTKFIVRIYRRLEE
jgi:ATP-dependent DNA helicase RecG